VVHRFGGLGAVYQETDGVGSRPRPLERMGQDGVICYAQKQTDRWPNENATERAWIDNIDARVTYDANGRKGKDVNGA
jgi:hypothetical protein